MTKKEGHVSTKKEGHVTKKEGHVTKNGHVSLKKSRDNKKRRSCGIKKNVTFKKMAFKKRGYV